MLGFVETISRVFHMEVKKSEQNSPMDLDCMTCTEIFGSGRPIGMDVPIRTVVRGVLRIIAVCFVVVSGAIAHTTLGRRTASETARRLGVTLTVFDFARSFNLNSFIYS